MMMMMTTRFWSVSFAFIVATSLFSLATSSGEQGHNQELDLPLVRLLQNISTSSCADENTASAQCWNKTDSTPTEFVSCQDCLETASKTAMADLITTSGTCADLQNAACTMLKSCPCTTPCLSEFTASINCNFEDLLTAKSCPSLDCSGDDSTTTPTTSDASSDFLFSVSILVTMIMGMVVSI